MEERNQGVMSRQEFSFRLAATTALIVGLLALWHLSYFVFLTFGAILFAVLLNAPARWLADHSRIPYKLCLTLVVLVFFGSFVGAGWLFAPAVTKQFEELSTRLPEAINGVVERLTQYEWGKTLLSYTPQPDDVLTGARDTFSRISSVFLNTIDAVAGGLVVLFMGIFLAGAPQTYFSGVLHLFPRSRRMIAREIGEKIGCTLRYWLIGQFFAMVVIGVATWAGLSLLGVRLAVGLGLLAGLLEFIPTFGPILSAVPAILIALLDGPKQALYVALLYTGIQFAENHLLIPLVQRRAVNLPPALSLIAILMLATVFGFLGLLFAIPMTAAIYVLVQEVYVKRTLKDPLG